MALKFLPVLVMTSCWVITDAYAPTNSFVTLRPTKRSAVVGMRAQMGRQDAPILVSRRATFACGTAVLLLRTAEAEAAPAASEEKRGSQRGKGLYIIENDFPFSTGRYPPRVLNLDALPEQEDNKAVFNAWGKCVQDSCQYVGLKQRYDGYKKFSNAVLLASAALAGDLRAAALGAMPFPAECAGTFEKALRRCVLLSNALMISENYGTSNEALVARFYLNEAFYSSRMLAAACEEGGMAAAADAWALCRDSWNSYLTLINRSIVPKVGAKFELVGAA